MKKRTRKWNRSYCMIVFQISCGFGFASTTLAQSGQWQLWASGLPPGLHPRLAVGPDHTIYYGYQGGPLPLGVIYQASNTLAGSGSFTAMPPIPYVSITNNVQALTTNASGEPVVGIFHGTASNQSSDPIVFVYRRAALSWQAASLDLSPSLGVYALARAPNGDLWFGAKWSRVYRSVNGGSSFSSIDESAFVAQHAPCYFPSYAGNASDGAIYSINIDRRGWVYAGTEGAGVVYSDDGGADWKPVDPYACLVNSPTQKNPNSPMQPVTKGGNVGAIGFTAENNLVWNGTSLFDFAGWTSSLGFADINSKTVSPILGITPYFLVRGLQTNKIITTENGTLFLHSGTNGDMDPNPPPPPQQSFYSLGILRSTDGIHWAIFNNGITGFNDGKAEGSLAVDGNRVFTATSDGKVWYFDNVSVPANVIFVDGFD